MYGKLTIDKSNIITIETDDVIITYEFAEFSDRFLARIIDVLIIFIPNSIIPIIPAWLYWAIQQSDKHQATIGQRSMKILTLSLDGKPISFGQATGRYFGNFLNLLTFLIGYFMYFFTDKKQCLHDLVSECIVVKQIDKRYKIGSV